MSADSTVVITTKDRRDDLRRAIDSALQQTVGPQVMVMDDGSSDGTAEMVRAEFPGIRLERSDIPKGYVRQRNLAADLATTPYLVSLDDDAVFASNRTLEQTLGEFDHPSIGAVAIPYLDVHKHWDRPRFAIPDDGRIWLCEHFIGTAHALRREVFLAVGGYRGELFNRGEERDFCLRLINRGYWVRVGRADPIHHYESPTRESRVIARHESRNFLLFAWDNVPWPYLPLHLAGATVNQVRRGFRMGAKGMFHTFGGIMTGHFMGLQRLPGRRPVTRQSYRFYRRLQYHGPLVLE